MLGDKWLLGVFLPVCAIIPSTTFITYSDREVCAVSDLSVSCGDVGAEAP